MFFLLKKIEQQNMAGIGTWKTSLNELTRTQQATAFNTMTASSLTVTGQLLTDTINCLDYFNPVWGCRFASSPITVTNAFTQVPIALLSGEGQGGIYDAGSNNFAFPTKGIYLFDFTCNSDTNNLLDLTYQVTLNEVAGAQQQFPLRVVPGNFTYAAVETGYRMFFFYVCTNTSIRVNINVIGQQISNVTNFLISQGTCVQASAFI